VELARAIRTEAAVAVKHWWGVGNNVVRNWRKALAVKRMENDGSRRLTLAASEKGAEAIRGAELSPEAVERRRQTALELGLGRNLQPGFHGRRWTDAEVALLGTIPDEEVSERTGWPWDSVRCKREELGIPNPSAQRRDWTPEEDAQVRTLSRDEAAERAGRSLGAVSKRRLALGLPSGRPKPRWWTGGQEG
jgi:hypothetical protein